ncbi:NAD(P)-binding protein [Wolfiporia cocos MD-104 SS10]|uniref:NAD(P)-binding protein n=1 Tax=Wolfiporia cocos (strain MD-104) TaxID=742152 RepID=A0A2H3JDK9_WOLCO|nr:NAD(P)-binding protein [Wolfiporia cocos MD-104 SS10]
MPSYVVAGASRGLGLEFVHQLLANGHTVIALARSPATSKGLNAISDKNLHVVKADITDSASLNAAAEETSRITGGTLDVLINNGVFQDPRYRFNDILHFPSESALLGDLNANWNTNVLGPILTTNAFLPLLRSGNTKKILTLSSGLGDAALNLASGFPGQVAYCIAKCALEMVNVKYALALKDEGFTCLAISPGVVNTAEASREPGIA